VVTKLDGATTFTYERQLGSGVAAGTCKTYPNTAKIAASSDQAEQTSSASVSVCAGQNMTISKNVIAAPTRGRSTRRSTRRSARSARTARRRSRTP
jgi:hypothetical protein